MIEAHSKQGNRELPLLSGHMSNIELVFQCREVLMVNWFSVGWLFSPVIDMFNTTARLVRGHLH